MPDSRERTKELEEFLNKNRIFPPDSGQWFMYAMVLQQFADGELGKSAQDSLIHHTQQMLESGDNTNLVRGVLEIFKLDPGILDKIMDLQSDVGFDVGASPYDQGPNT